MCPKSQKSGELKIGKLLIFYQSNKTELRRDNDESNYEIIKMINKTKKKRHDYISVRNT